MAGVLAWIEGDLEKAELEWREAVRLRPDMAKGHYNLGILLRAKGDKVRANAELSDALRLNPDSPLYRFSLGILQLEMGNKLGGTANLDKVRAQMERPDLSAAALAYQMWLNKRYEAAAQAAARAYEKNPELLEAYLIRGRSLMALKKRAEAKEMFTKALQLDKNTKEAERALAEIERQEAELKAAQAKAAAEKAAAEKAAAEKAAAEKANAAQGTPEGGESQSAAEEAQEPAPAQESAP